MSSLGANLTSALDPTFFIDGMTGLLASNMLVGLPANIYVVWLILSGTSGPVVSELFALNLAISEILFCCLSFYVMLHFLLKMSMAVGVVVLQVFLEIGFISRPVFQTCICLERYLAVVHPILFIRFKPLRYRLVSCVFDWLLILLNVIFRAFVLSFDISVYFFIAKSLLFFFVLLYCGISVLLVLKQPGPGDKVRNSENSNSMKRKAFKVIAVTLVFTSMTQLLQVTMLGPTILQPSLKLLLQVTLFSLAVNILSSFVTPLLFLQRAKKLVCIQI
ncbi:somatostatin receptor type 5 [Austrofundulus limnaeus]|uniref:Somatostatin receptor type 5 n=1 Tax=Austrofundulus limnaeus TaxID=52670 RepID=A0A2I4CDJ2_AUSLI|nr:PREDICTED: somatostatin receptor type 5-like [Austrofundulus limnaeus]